MTAAPCSRIDPFSRRGKRLILTQCCPGCPLRQPCAQRAADFGETSGPWGGLDLDRPEQRAMLPAPTPPRPDPVRPRLEQGQHISDLYPGGVDPASR